MMSELNNWLSSKRQGLVGMAIGFVATVFLFLVTTAIDQAVRNITDERMQEHSLRELLPTRIEHYKDMSLPWRQVISEVSLQRRINGDSESRMLFATLEHFNVAQLQLVDKIAPYLVLIRKPVSYWEIRTKRHFQAPVLS